MVQNKVASRFLDCMSLPTLHSLCQAGIPEPPSRKAVLFHLLNLALILSNWLHTSLGALLSPGHAVTSELDPISSGLYTWSLGLSKQQLCFLPCFPLYFSKRSQSCTKHFNPRWKYKDRSSALLSSWSFQLHAKICTAQTEFMNCT